MLAKAVELAPFFLTDREVRMSDLTRRQAMAGLSILAAAASPAAAQPQAPQGPVNASATSEGDTLYFEVRGKGEPLLMISGATGDGGIYGNVAERLADTYQVITYDRRGNSRSSRNEPQNFEVSQQARDAVAVLKAAGHASARIFANSGGAVIALEMAKTQPQAIRGLVVHEPPVIRIVPDYKELAARYADINRIAHTEGWQKAYGEFRALVFGTGPIPMTPAMAKLKDVFGRAAKNQEFFVMQELQPLTFYAPDIAAIKANKVKIVMAAGKATLEKNYFYGRTAQILAEQLGCAYVEFPGAHLSFMDIPEQWEPVLRGVLAKM